MDKLLESILAAAKVAAAVIPGAQPVGAAIVVGEKLLGIIDDMSDGVDDPASQEQMQATRAELAAAVSAKAEATADRLDGGDEAG